MPIISNLGAFDMHLTVTQTEDDLKIYQATLKSQQSHYVLFGVHILKSQLIQPKNSMLKMN